MGAVQNFEVFFYFVGFFKQKIQLEWNQIMANYLLAMGEVRNE